MPRFLDLRALLTPAEVFQAWYVMYFAAALLVLPPVVYTMTHCFTYGGVPASPQRRNARAYTPFQNRFPD